MFYRSYIKHLTLATKKLESFYVPFTEILLMYNIYSIFIDN